MGEKKRRTHIPRSRTHFLGVYFVFNTSSFKKLHFLTTELQKKLLCILDNTANNLQQVHLLFKSPDMENLSSNNQNLGKQMTKGPADREHLYIKAVIKAAANQQLKYFLFLLLLDNFS